MAASKDDIRIRIAGDLADIKKTLKDLKRETKSAGDVARKTGQDWNQLGTSLKSLKSRVVGIVGSFFTINSIVSQVGQSLRNLQDIDRQSKALGTTNEAFQKLVFTFRQFDLESNDVSDALGTIADRGRDAEGGMQSFIDDFRLLGVSVDDIRGKRPDELFRIIAERIGSIEDPTRRTAGIVRIFGDDLGRRLSPLLIGGAKRLDEYGKKAEEAGAVLEEGLVKQGADAADALRELNEQLNADKARIIANNAVAIRDVASAIATLESVTASGISNFGRGLGVLLAKATGAPEAADALELVNSSIDETQARIERLQRLIKQGVPVQDFHNGLKLLSTDQANEQLRQLQIRLERFKTARDEVTRNGGSFDLASPSQTATPKPELSPISVSSALPQLKQFQSQIAAIGVVLTDQLSRLRTTLDSDLAQNLVSIRDYYRQRSDLETKAIDQQIAGQRSALAVLDEEIRLTSARGDSTVENESKRAKLVAQITVLERQRGDVAVRASREQAIAERDLADRLGAVRSRLQELQGNVIGAQTTALEREYRELLKRLVAEGDKEGEALVRNLIDVELAKARLDQLDTEVQRSFGDLARQEKRIQAQVETGTISEREGRLRIIELHRQTAKEVGALIPLMEQLAAATGNPEAIARLKDLELEIEQLGQDADRTWLQIRDNAQDAAESAFSSFISGAESAKSAWASLVDDIRQKAADLISEKIFDKLFHPGGSAAPGGGGFFSAIGNFLASVFHEGGIAGQGRQFRSIPKLAFAGAPRLHGGGLAAGEVPAILRSDEEVLTRNDPRHRANLGGGNVNVTIQTQDVQSFSRAAPGQIGAAIASSILRSRNRNR